MQSRIMELASQREFFIATNSRLRQTLTAIPVSKNGVQMAPLTTTSNTINSMQPTNHHYHHQPIDINNLTTRSHRNHPVVMVTDSKDTAVPISSSNVKFNSNSSLEGYIPTFGNMLSQDVRPQSASQTVSHNSSIGGPLGNNASYHYSNETTPTTNGIHEVTYVTNSVQGPIAAFTGLPDNPVPHHSLSAHRHST